MANSTEGNNTGHDAGAVTSVNANSEDSTNSYAPRGSCAGCLFARELCFPKDELCNHMSAHSTWPCRFCDDVLEKASTMSNLRAMHCVVPCAEHLATLQPQLRKYGDTVTEEVEAFYLDAERRGDDEARINSNHVAIKRLVESVNASVPR